MTTPEKKDFEKAIDEYGEAEKRYKTMEEAVLSGEVVAGLVEKAVGRDREWIKQEFQTYMSQLQAALEDLNVKLATAKSALRSVVQLTPTQQRGPDGKTFTLSYGPLTVSSATRRWLDAESLLKLAAKHQVLDRLLALTSFDKSGKEFRLVEQIWKIDYENVSKWLKDQGLNSLLDGSYDEKEETPRVTGAKPLAFLGERIEKT